MPIVREAFELIAAGTQAFTGGDQGRHLVLAVQHGVFSFLAVAAAAAIVPEIPLAGAEHRDADLGPGAPCQLRRD